MDEQNDFYGTNGPQPEEPHEDAAASAPEAGPQPVPPENAPSGAAPGAENNFNNWQSYQASAPGPDPTQSAPNPDPYGTNPNPYGPGQNGYHNPANGFQNFGGQQTPPQQEYRWNYEDYDKISKGNVGYKPKSNTGLKVFAVVMTVVFLVTAAVPLIPGGSLYHTMRYFVAGDFAACSAQGLSTMLLALAIAAGMIVPTSLFQLVRRVRLHRARLKKKT